MSSFCPDVNLWIALVYRAHRQHPSAATWFGGLKQDSPYFCRLSQISFLRLLSHPEVMQQEVKSQREAWRIYDRLLDDERISFHSESDPEHVNLILRRLTSGRGRSSKQWQDAYLAAFAEMAGLTIVTFDRSMRQMAGSVLLS
jgi:uncharacterized protein